MTDKEFSLHRSIKSGVSLIVFSTEWCEPCKELSLLIPVLQETYHERVFFAKIDDENTAVLEHYNIINFPTVLFFNDGAEVERIRGVKKIEDYISSIDYHLTHKPTKIDNDDPLYDISDL